MKSLLAENYLARVYPSDAFQSHNIDTRRSPPPCAVLTVPRNHVLASREVGITQGQYALAGQVVDLDCNPLRSISREGDLHPRVKRIGGHGK